MQLWTTALPAAIDGGASLGGYIAAIIVIGFGTGGIKSNIAPLIADQYQRRKMAIKTIPKTMVSSASNKYHEGAFWWFGMIG